MRTAGLRRISARCCHCRSAIRAGEILRDRGGDREHARRRDMRGLRASPRTHHRPRVGGSAAFRPLIEREWPEVRRRDRGTYETAIIGSRWQAVRGEDLFSAELFDTYIALAHLTGTPRAGAHRAATACAPGCPAPRCSSVGWGRHRAGGRAPGEAIRANAPRGSLEYTPGRTPPTPPSTAPRAAGAARSAPARTATRR